MYKALTYEGGAPSSTLQNKISRDITKLTFIRKVLLLCLLQSISTFISYVIEHSTNDISFLFKLMRVLYLFCFFLLSFYFLHPYMFYPINYIVLLIVTVSEIIFIRSNLSMYRGYLLPFSSFFSITLYSLCLIYSLFIKSRFRIWIPCTLFLPFVFTFIWKFMPLLFYYIEGWAFLIFTLYFATRLRYYLTCYEEKKLNWVFCALMIIIDSPHHLFISVSVIYSIPNIGRLSWAFFFCYVRIVINLIQYLLNIMSSSIGGDFCFPITDCVCCWNNKGLKGYQREEAINEVSTLV